MIILVKVIFLKHNYHKATHSGPKQFFFSFRNVTKEKISFAINRLLNRKKSALSNEISTKPLYIFSNNFNSCPQSEMFPGKLKLPEAVSVYEKTNKKGKSNYRPISILSTISKIYERCIQTQLNGQTKLNFASFLSKFLCGHH